MTCTRARSTHILLISALALTAFGAAPALSEPAPAAAPHDDPLHPCTVLLCLPGPGKAAETTTPAGDAVSGTASGKRMHKPYTVQADTCAVTDMQPVAVASDPEEGGQIARTAKTKPTVSDMKVTKTTDVASPNLAETPGSGTPQCSPGQH